MGVEISAGLLWLTFTILHSEIDVEKSRWFLNQSVQENLTKGEVFLHFGQFACLYFDLSLAPDIFLCSDGLWIYNTHLKCTSLTL